MGSQLEDALSEKLAHLSRLRLRNVECDVERDDYLYVVVIAEDRRQMTWRCGETLGEAWERAKQRWRIE